MVFPAQELTRSDKDLIIAAVASIVGDTRWTGQPDQSSLRLQLTDLLAKRGDTGKLLLQIEELKKLGYAQVLIQYFTAWYHINANQFVKARQILVTLQSALKPCLRCQVQVEDQRVVSSVLQRTGGAGDAAKRLSSGSSAPIRRI